MKYVIVNFYHFFEVKDKDYLLYKFLYIGKKKNIKGSIIIASEGVNAALSGSQDSIDELLFFFKSYVQHVNFITHYSQANFSPFNKFKVKIKNEIVSLKNNCLGGCAENYISPANWDDFINCDDVLLVDIRNDYESQYGYFRGSIRPNVKSFREMPAWFELNKTNSIFQNKSKLATYCTGGIRCEKFIAFLKNIGYNKNIFQLQGGILGYLKERSSVLSKNSWFGDCFVFDNRILL